MAGATTTTMSTKDGCIVLCLGGMAAAIAVATCAETDPRGSARRGPSTST